MADSITDEELVLSGNVCFGCGQENPDGLYVSVYRDPDHPNRILGRFRPKDHMIGFPGIIHGGAIYTALDCMATWSGMVLRKTKALWVLRSAAMKYHRPAFQGNSIFLAAEIAEQGEEWEAIEVRAGARDPEGNLLTEGTFKVIPVSPQQFKSMTGLEELPEGWENWLTESGT